MKQFYFLQKFWTYDLNHIRENGKVSTVHFTAVDFSGNYTPHLSDKVFNLGNFESDIFQDDIDQYLSPYFIVRIDSLYSVIENWTVLI